MLTAFTTMPLFEGANLEHKTNESFTAMPSTAQSGEVSGWMFTVGAGACLYTGCTYYLHHCYTCKDNGQASILVGHSRTLDIKNHNVS